MKNIPNIMRMTGKYKLFAAKDVNLLIKIIAKELPPTAVSIPTGMRSPFGLPEKDIIETVRLQPQVDKMAMSHLKISSV